MQHDEQWLGQVQGVLIGGMDSRDDALLAGKIITNACREYGENIATPLEARIVELEKYISGLKHTCCECGDEFINVSESHYMIIENGKCVNCRCADAAPLEIRDGFLDGLYESRKLNVKER